MFDVLIVGGGLVGASLACALGNSTLRVGLIEPHDTYGQGEFGADGRASAVALGSSKIWQQIGVWQSMVDRGVTPMHSIQISDGDYPQVLRLNRSDMAVESLGYIVENRVSLSALWEGLKGCPNVSVICPGRVLSIEPGISSSQVEVMTNQGIERVFAKLVVAADGSRSAVRAMVDIPIDRRAYNQSCLVATVTTSIPHHNIAYERFRASGPFAILPLDHDRCCVVWTINQEDTATYLALPPPVIEQKLQENFGPHLGKVSLLSPSLASYTPQWMHAQTYIQSRCVLLGDAAHTTHPVAGQGMNLGIRDVAALARVLRTAGEHHEDPGAVAVLQRYQAQRYWDNLGVIMLTDITNRIFSNQHPAWQLLRRSGLALLQFLPFKQVLMYLMMGLHCADDPRTLAAIFPLPRSIR